MDNEWKDGEFSLATAEVMVKAKANLIHNNEIYCKVWSMFSIIIHIKSGCNVIKYTIRQIIAFFLDKFFMMNWFVYKNENTAKWVIVELYWLFFSFKKQSLLCIHHYIIITMSTIIIIILFLTDETYQNKWNLSRKIIIVIKK